MPKTPLYSFIRNLTILLNLRFYSSSPGYLVRVDTQTNVRVTYVAINIFLSNPKPRNLERFFMLSPNPYF